MPRESVYTTGLYVSCNGENLAKSKDSTWNTSLRKSVQRKSKVDSAGMTDTVIHTVICNLHWYVRQYVCMYHRLMRQHFLLRALLLRTFLSFLIRPCRCQKCLGCVQSRTLSVLWRVTGLLFFCLVFTPAESEWQIDFIGIDASRLDSHTKLQTIRNRESF